MIKRLFDIVTSAVGLLMLAPLLAAVAACVRLDSPGPVLFRQERVGRGGRHFQIYKFRTMVADAAQRGPQITVGLDPRVTRCGAPLRRSRLDELPQLLNVLKGDMSLVGPRPEVPKYVALYPPELRDKVLSIRPGITDDAALAYADEAELLEKAADSELLYTREILPRKLAMYERYVNERSFARDLSIIVRTVLRVWIGRSAARGHDG